MARMGLARAIEHPVLQADRFYGTGQDGCAARRAMALACERCRDFNIASPFAGQAEDRCLHLRRALADRFAALGSRAMAVLMFRRASAIWNRLIRSSNVTDDQS